MYGRKPFLLFSPTVNCILKAMVAMNPSLMMIGIERVVDGAITTLAGSTTCSAMLSDLYSGKDLGIAYAKLGSAAGLGAIGGSFLAGRLVAYGLKPVHIFGVSSAIAAAQLSMHIIGGTQETLMDHKKKAIEKASDMVANPISFFKLFTQSHSLRILVLVAGLQCMPEGKNISDLLQIYNMQDVGMTDAMRANFVTAFGACMVFGGRLAKPSIETFGNRGHTT